MRVSSLKALFLRDVIVPLLCAVLALGSLASARTIGSKSVLALTGSHIELCLPSDSKGGERDLATHNCDACCLPVSTGLGPLPNLTLLPVTLIDQLRIVASYAPNALPNPYLPWSRGPPALG